MKKPCFLILTVIILCFFVTACIAKKTNIDYYSDFPTDEELNFLVKNFWKAKEPYEIDVIFYRSMAAAFADDSKKTKKKLKTFTKKDLMTLFRLQEVNIAAITERYLTFKNAFHFLAFLEDAAGLREYPHTMVGILGRFLSGSSGFLNIEFYPEMSKKSIIIEVGSGTLYDESLSDKDDEKVILHFTKDGDIGKITPYNE